jgi:hypothetical protein
MKSAIVKIQIQFDLVIGNGQIQDVYRLLHEMNTTLQQEFPFEQPQIFVDAVSDEDIEIVNDENEDHAPEVIWSEIRDTFEDEGE